MRFSEKSFEIRFCAAFTAALTPYDRNPKWFGLTQEQERRAGIDTMVKIGGKLYIFQFKASKAGIATNPYFHVEAEQCHALSKFTHNHPKSVFYVFPAASTVKQANATKCLIKDSYVVPAHKIASFFKGNKHKTRTLHLDQLKSNIYTNKIKNKESASTACSMFGCRCNANKPINYQLDNEKNLIAFRGPLIIDESIFGSDTTQEEPSDGIELNMQSDALDSIKSAQDFEDILFADRVNKSLNNGVYGLFLPMKKNSI